MRRTEPTSEADPPVGFLRAGESVEIPQPPNWRERECRYPESWEGPQPGGVALFLAATSAEVSAAYPEQRPPGDAQTRRKPPPEEARYAFEAASRLAQVHVEGIDGDEVIHATRIDGQGSDGSLELVLESRESDGIWKLEPRVAETFVGVADADAFGARWAEVLTKVHQDPPRSTPEQRAQALRLTELLGGDTRGRTVENFNDGYVGHTYSPQLWQGVACELAQLARFASRTGRDLYLTRYVD